MKTFLKRIKLIDFPLLPPLRRRRWRISGRRREWPRTTSTYKPQYGIRLIINYWNFFYKPSLAILQKFWLDLRIPCHLQWWLHLDLQWPPCWAWSGISLSPEYWRRRGVSPPWLGWFLLGDWAETGLVLYYCLMGAVFTQCPDIGLRLSRPIGLMLVIYYNCHSIYSSDLARILFSILYTKV